MGTNWFKYKDKAERFWSKVLKTKTCWLWRGTIDYRWGYGRFRDNSDKLVLAHRFAYELLIRPLRSWEILHHKPTCPKCCVNPEHLTVTTQEKHIDDFHGRNKKGQFQTEAT